MTIRYDSEGNPYDDGEYDYSQEAPQEEAPQREFAYEGGGSGGGSGGGDYRYEEEPVQQDPVFVVDEPATDPYASADSTFVINDPMIDSSLVQDFGISDPVVDAFKQDPSEPYVYEDTGDPYDPPKESDVYDEYPTTQGIIAEPIVAEPIASEPVYADIRMGATSSPSSGTARISTSQFENARATPFRGGQDGTVRTPIRDRLFGRKGRYTQVEQPIEQIMEPFVAPEVEQLRFSPGTADTTDQVSMQIPVPVQNLDPLAPTSIGEYDYRPATIQGPPSELMRDPEFQPFDAAAVPPSDRNGRFLGRVRFTDENNKAVRGFPFGDNAGQPAGKPVGQPAGQPLPEGGVFPLIKPPVENNINQLKDGAVMRPLIRPPVGGIGADVGNPNPFADVDEAELDRQERLRLERAKEAMRPIDPALRAMQDEEAKRNQAAEKLGRDKVKLIESVQDEENQKRALAIFQDPNSSKFAKEKAERDYNRIQGRINDRKKEEEDLAHEKFVQEKVRRALNRFEKGATLEEAKTVPDLPNEPALRNLQPLGLGKGVSKYDTFKGFDDKEGEHALKPNANRNAKLNNPDVEVINRNESKAEELESYKFISSGPNGLTPKIFPLASQVFDASVAEKNLNEMKDLRNKELIKVSPTGDLLKSQLRQSRIYNLLNDKSLTRVYDYVNEVHKGVSITNTQEKGTGVTRDINGKITSSNPGDSLRQGISSSFTNKGKNAALTDGNESNRTRQGISKDASIGAGTSETEKLSIGSSVGQTGGDSNKVSNADNRMQLYNSLSKQEQAAADAIVKASESARLDIERQYNPAIEKYEEKYKQLQPEVKEVGNRLKFLGDITGAGALYPKQAIDSTSPTAKMNIQQFNNRFNTTDPNLQDGLKDISVKHALFDQGDVDHNMTKRIDQLSNPAIKGILEGTTHIPAISAIIKGGNPDVQYTAEKNMYDAEALMRIERLDLPDPNDKSAVAKYQAAVKSAASNSTFGKAVMAAKVLKAHDDLTQYFTNASVTPGKNMSTEDRTLAPFDQYLDRVFQQTMSDPKNNMVFGAVAIEMALNISSYKKEMAKIQDSKSWFTDTENEAKKYMIRALSDPTNRDFYLKKVQELSPKSYRGTSKSFAPAGSVQPEQKGLIRSMMSN